MMALSYREFEMLEMLTEEAGITTGQVARGVTMFGSNMRQHSGAVRTWLMELKKIGLVDFLDDQKPVCLRAVVPERGMAAARRRSLQWNADAVRRFKASVNGGAGDAMGL